MKILVITHGPTKTHVCTAKLDEKDLIFLFDYPSLFYMEAWLAAVDQRLVDANNPGNYEIEVFENGNFISKQKKAIVLSFEEHRRMKCG